MTEATHKAHPLHASVTRLLEMRASPDFSTEAVAGNETYTFARDKVFSIVQALADLLGSTPAQLTSYHGLNQIQSQLQQPLNEITAFLGNKNPAHIANAANQLEQNVIPLLWTFMPQVHKSAAKTFPALIQAQSAAAQEAIAQLRALKDELASQLRALQDRASGAANKLAEVEENAAKERAQAAATVANLEQQFTARETDRQVKFEAALGEQRKEVESEVEAAKTTAQKLVDELVAHRDNAARIVQVVGNIGVTGNYQRIAKDESDQANLWRWITVAIFGAGVAVAATTFIKFWGEPFTTETGLSVFIRLLYAIAITAPAWYTARESARHRTNSDRAKQTELELASLGPFIELMPEDKKVAIRDRLATAYFGRQVEPHTISHPLDPSAVQNAATEIIKAAR